MFSNNAPGWKSDLEAQLKRELNLALRYYRVGNNTGRTRSIVNEVVWLSEDSMVEGVKEFCAKLEPDLFRKSKELTGRQVGTFFAWPR